MKPQKFFPISLFLLIIILFFSFGFYLFWQPDNLKDFIPEGAFFYLHFDLNNCRRIGVITSQWFHNQETKNFLIKQKFLTSLTNNLFKDKIIKDLSEVALIGLKTKNNQSFEKEIVFLVRIKKWANSNNLIKGMQKFFVKKIDKKVYLISQNPISLTKRKTGYFFNHKSISFSNFFNPPVLKGFFVPGLWLGALKNNSGLIEFKAFYLGSKKMEFNFSSLFNYNLSDIFLNYNSGLTEQVNNSTNNFVLIYPQLSTITLFKKELQKFLAQQNPLEEEKILPDKTTFIELVVDPSKVNFVLKNIKGKNVYYWSQNFKQKEGKINHLALWQEQGYFFISNNPNLGENFINNFKEFNAFFKKQVIQKAFYISLNKWGIKSFFLIKLPLKTKGIFIFDS